MSLFVLATGALTADPTRREGARGDFATAQIRAATEDGPAFVSLIAFGAAADELLSHQAGAAISISGRAKLTSWTGKDGVERHGISVVVEQLVSAAAAQRADRARSRTTDSWFARGGGR